MGACSLMFFFSQTLCHYHPTPRSRTRAPYRPTHPFILLLPPSLPPAVRHSTSTSPAPNTSLVLNLACSSSSQVRRGEEMRRQLLVPTPVYVLCLHRFLSLLLSFLFPSQTSSCFALPKHILLPTHPTPTPTRHLPRFVFLSTLFSFLSFFLFYVLSLYDHPARVFLFLTTRMQPLLLLLLGVVWTLPTFFQGLLASESTCNRFHPHPRPSFFSLLSACSACCS